ERLACCDSIGEVMADPSGIYELTARNIDAATVSFQVDPASGELRGTLGIGPDAISIAGQWDDATSHITFNDVQAPGEWFFTHFFDGYVSAIIGGTIMGLAGTYHDIRLRIVGGRLGVLRLVKDNGGWCASRAEIIS